MKKALIILLSAITVFTYGQNIIFSGKITNPKGDKIKIYKKYNRDTVFSVEIDTNGVFKTNINDGEEAYYNYFHGGEIQTIYLSPGDSIYMTIDTKYFDETAKYSGRGAEVNNYIIEAYLLDEMLKSNVHQHKELLNISPEKLAERFNRFEKINNNLLEDLIRENENLPENFIKEERIKIKYSNLNKIRGLKYAYERYNKDTVYEFSDDFLNKNVYSHIEFDTSFFSYNRYKLAINNYLTYLAKKEYKKDSIRYETELYGYYAALVNIIENNKLFDKDYKDYCHHYRAYVFLEGNYTFSEEPEYYADFKKYCSNEILKNKIANKLKENEEMIKKLSAEDSTLINDRQFTRFASRYIYLKTNKKNNLDRETPILLRTEKTFEIINEIVSSEIIKNYLLSSNIDNYMNRAGVDYDKNLVKQFNKQCTSKDYKEEIAEKIENLKGLVEGKPAPSFTGNDITGKEYSLSDFKGKYVYIDVWATWCSPCLGQLPHLEKLEEEFKNKDIVFVSVSVDSDKAAWETMIKDKNMKGIQLHAPEAWESEICKKYCINSIPRFILIDKEGKLINSNVPRPSQNIREILKELMP